MWKLQSLRGSERYTLAKSTSDETYQLGDTVLFGQATSPRYGVIIEFNQDTSGQDAKLLLFEQKKQSRELYITPKLETIQLDLLKMHIKVVPKDEVDINDPVCFLCCFAKQKGKPSGPFQWRDFMANTAESLPDLVKDILRGRFETRETKSLPKFQTDDGSDSEAKSPVAPRTPRKKRKIAEPVTPSTPTTPRTPSSRRLPLRPGNTPKRQDTPHSAAKERLHVSTVPESLPCRDKEFSEIYLAIESALQTETGTCVYVSGTPGTGKTATVREAIAQLELRRESKELGPFVFLEINGMKLAHANGAYNLIWEELRAYVPLTKGQTSRHRLVETASIIEEEFQKSNDQRPPLVVMVDELDQLITRNLGVMYNLFNWPSLPKSKLIVVAIANTLDLPERLLSNKISSRLGLTRIQFRGYTFEELQEIIHSRLEEVDIFSEDAVRFVARKVGNVSGDARRALDVCRLALETSGGKRVGLEHVRIAFSEIGGAPLKAVVTSFSAATKIFLLSVLARVRRNENSEVTCSETLHQCEQFAQLDAAGSDARRVLFDGATRMLGYRHAIVELTDAGILAQQVLRGEATARLRLLVAPERLSEILSSDRQYSGFV